MKQSAPTLFLYAFFMLLNIGFFACKAYIPTWDLFLLLVSLLTFTFSFLKYLFIPEKMRKAIQKETASVHLLLLAFFTALGTLISPESIYSITDIHRSPFYIMSASYLMGLIAAYIMLNTLLYKGIKRAGLLLAHVGTFLIFIGSLYSLTFRIEGEIDLTEGAESSVFEQTFNGARTGTFHPIGANIHLKDFNVEKSDPQVVLRFYTKGILTESLPISKLSLPQEAPLGYKNVTLLQYLSHTSESTKVEEDLTKQSKTSTLTFTFNMKEKEHFLIAKETEDGFISNTLGEEKLLFTRVPTPAPKQKEGVLYIDAQTLTLAEKGKPLRTLRLPEKIQIEQDQYITIRRITPHAHVIKKRYEDEESPFNPSLQAQINGEDVWLNPYAPALTHIGSNTGMHLTLKEGEATSFESTVLLQEKNKQKWTKKILRVNTPLTFGACKVYQARYDEKYPNTSGFNVTCDGGRLSVKFGIWMMLIGMVILMIRRRLFVEDKV